MRREIGATMKKGNKEERVRMEVMRRKYTRTDACFFCVGFIRTRTQVGLTDDVPLKYTVTIREIYTTAKKAEVSLIDGH